jgi:hypothetical protein
VSGYRSGLKLLAGEKLSHGRSTMKMRTRPGTGATLALLILAALFSLLRPSRASSPGSFDGSGSNPCRIFGWAFDQKYEYAYPKIHIYVDGAPAKRKHVYAINEADGYPMKPIRCY